MKANYNLALRINPASKTKEKLWYAVTASKGSMDEDETAAVATADTTLSKGEYKHAMEITSEKLMPLIVGGINVTIGKLGKLRLSFGSTGVKDIKDFNPQTMIKNAKFVFTPSKELKQALANATFELEGVVEDSIKYGSMASYLKAKGLPSGGGEETGGGEEGDGGESPDPIV